MASKYEDSGALNHQTDKRTEKSPDFWGSLELSEATLRGLVEKAKAKGAIKIKLSGWNRSGQRGDFISLSAAVFEDKKQERSDDWG